MNSVDNGNSASNDGREKFDDRILAVAPLDAGPRMATFRGGAIHVTRPPGAQKIVRSENNVVSIMLAPTTGLKRAIGSDKLQEHDVAAGGVAITPVNADVRLSWKHSRENVTIVLPHTSLLELAEHELDSSNIELRPLPFGTVDSWALHIAKLLKAELAQAETSNELYVDSLITVFAVHLLRNYAGIQKPFLNAAGGLSLRQTKRVRDYMEANFARKLSVKELASVAGLSPHYFIQVFAETFGKSPHQYVMELRLDLAEKLLTLEDFTIMEVAHLSGFATQSHLTTTMRKHRNTTPMQVRQRR